MFVIMFICTVQVYLLDCSICFQRPHTVTGYALFMKVMRAHAAFSFSRVAVPTQFCGGAYSFLHAGVIAGMVLRVMNVVRVHAACSFAGRITLSAFGAGTPI